MEQIKNLIYEKQGKNAGENTEVNNKKFAKYLETYWFAHNHTVVNRTNSIAKITENVHTGLKIKICVAYEIHLKHKD